MRMLESTLHRLIPNEVSTFAKLRHGKPYHFDRWENGCLYYWFEGVTKHTKRLPKSEIRSALRQLRDTGWIHQKTFGEICRTARSDGPCGFAVLGRIFEAMGVAVYSGNAGFKLTNADEATKLLEEKPI
jgi:hypothetical protein